MSGPTESAILRALRWRHRKQKAETPAQLLARLNETAFGSKAQLPPLGGKMPEPARPKIETAHIRPGVTCPNCFVELNMYHHAGVCDQCGVKGIEWRQDRWSWCVCGLSTTECDCTPR